MKMKTIYIAAIGLLVILSLITLIFVYEDDLNKKYECIKYKEFILEKWQGTVSKKYLNNSNHNAETFEISFQPPYTMFRDGTEFYKLLEIGDSIVKNLNTDTIKVYRQDQQYSFRIYFGCEE